MQKHILPFYYLLFNIQMVAIDDHWLETGFFSSKIVWKNDDTLVQRSASVYGNSLANFLFHVCDMCSAV